MSKIQEIYLDILHVYRSDMVAGFPRYARSKFYGTSVFEKITNVARFKAKTGRDFLFSVLRIDKTVKKDLYQKDWLYILGSNNYHSLKFLADKKQTVYVGPYHYQIPEDDLILITLNDYFLNMLRRLPTFMALLIKHKEIRRCWDVAFKATGLYESSLAYLKKYQPRCIIFSNDHSLEPRAMLLAAKELKIPTFYVQHACIRSDFPPLKFTCSFLEGQDSLDKYRASGEVEGCVELVGVPRIESYLPKKRTRQTVKRIGLCSNLLDNIPAMEVLLKDLRTAFPDYQLSYRPHPIDKRKINLDPSILISDSRAVNSFEFLLEQDLIIAGNTSIHYEAAMLNIHAVYYKFDVLGETEDMYGFVENGLVEEATSSEDLIAMIKQSSEGKGLDWEKVRYYNSVLGTGDEGGSVGLVRGGIKRILNNKIIANTKAKDVR